MKFSDLDVGQDFYISEFKFKKISGKEFVAAEESCVMENDTEVSMEPSYQTLSDLCLADQFQFVTDEKIEEFGERPATIFVVSLRGADDIVYVSLSTGKQYHCIWFDGDEKIIRVPPF